jgi:hypothetical protein
MRQGRRSMIRRVLGDSHLSLAQSPSAASDASRHPGDGSAPGGQDRRG